MYTYLQQSSIHKAVKLDIESILGKLHIQIVRPHLSGKHLALAVEPRFRV